MIFDQPLVPGVVDHTNWALDFGEQVWSPTYAIATASYVTIVFEAGGPNGPFNVCSYHPPPFDVLSLATGTPAPAFSNFPVMQA